MALLWWPSAFVWCFCHLVNTNELKKLFSLIILLLFPFFCSSFCQFAILNVLCPFDRWFFEGNVRQRQFLILNRSSRFVIIPLFVSFQFSLGTISCHSGHVCLCVCAAYTVLCVHEKKHHMSFSFRFFNWFKLILNTLSKFLVIFGKCFTKIFFSSFDIKNLNSRFLKKAFLKTIILKIPFLWGLLHFDHKWPNNMRSHICQSERYSTRFSIFKLCDTAFDRLCVCVGGGKMICRV